MTREARLWILAGLLYLAAGCVAFGHAAARAYERENELFAACRARPPEGRQDWCFDGRTANAAASGMVAFIVWPLYLSWEAWQ